MTMSEPWRDIARRKQEQQRSRIPKEWVLSSPPGPEVKNVLDVPRTCGILTAEELAITENYDATALAAAIRNRELKCIDVARAFCKRAAIAQQLTSCLTEIFFDIALRRASYLDHHLEQYGRPVGPLHGVPISLKDSFRITGFDASVGVASLCFKPSNSTSPLASILLSAGAVLYCKTNIPHTLMSLDSYNNIFGRVLNPRNTLLTAGGSSGGEGALGAMNGSVLGIGTDIGGSIRIPALCNGLYGIKPSANRIPNSGQSGDLPGLLKIMVEPSSGPISRSLRDCELLFSVVSAAKPWELDPWVIPGLWSETDNSASVKAVNERPLTIAMMRTDGLINPLPPVQRVLDEVAQAMRNKGIRVIDIPPPPSFRDAQSLANALFNVEGNNSKLDALAAMNEPLSPWLAPRLQRKKPKSLEQLRDLHAQREQLMKDVQVIWTQPVSGSLVQVDALVCPAAPHPVPPIDSWGGVSYTSSWVLLDCPAGTLPVRDVVEADLHEDTSTASLGSWDDINKALWDRKKVDRNIYLDSPLSVQVVAPRLQEKRLYRAMSAIDWALKHRSSSNKSKL